ncbi:MAG: hypothetical protein LAO79_05935 [Acidobacteriia bacterium]|nr:hypothetical protein [Terriglobia bacterium]
MHKQEFPPLLPQGFHSRSLEEVRELCVTNFKESTVRAEIMAGLEAIYEQAQSLGIDGEIWLDGSFLTEKINPEDADFILVVDHQYRDSALNYLTPEEFARAASPSGVSNTTRPALPQGNPSGSAVACAPASTLIQNRSCEESLR